MVALKDGYRESGESWADLLRDCGRRGMRAPMLTVGDGALVFGGEVVKRQQLGLVGGDLLDGLGELRAVELHERLDRRLGVLLVGFWKALAEVFPDTREQRCWVHKTANVLDSLPKSAQPGAKKAIQDIYSAEDWIHLRTTNPIESTFATVRLRTKVTRGAGSRTAALAMVFKLVESAQQRWRAVNAPHLVALVRASARFERGQLVERPEAVAA